MRHSRTRLLVVLIAGVIGGLAPALRAGTTAPAARDEEGVWKRAGEEEEVILRSGFVVEDVQLEAYLAGVVARLAATDGFDGDAFVVRVLKDPSLNAFALPHGSLFIHTGLLARMMNEAQLASVLAHEMTHVTQRHGWKGYRSLKTKTGLLAVMSAASIAAGNFSGVAQLMGELGTIAAISGYSQALEKEADVEGWHRLAGAGYDTNEAPITFRLLMADLEAHERKEPFFFGSHPKLAERERNFRQLNASKKNASPGETGKEKYAAAIMPVLLINGELEMRAGRHDAARDQLWRYRAERPADVRVRWLLGENERLDKVAGNLTEARDLLDEAIALDPRFSQSHRSLGLICYRAGELATAAVHLRSFLELEPAAHDRAYLETYLQQCESAQSQSSSP